MTADDEINKLNNEINEGFAELKKPYSESADDSLRDKKPATFWIPWYWGGTKEAPYKVYVQCLCDLESALCAATHKKENHDLFIEHNAYDALAKQVAELEAQLAPGKYVVMSMGQKKHWQSLREEDLAKQVEQLKAENYKEVMTYHETNIRLLDERKDLKSKLAIATEALEVVASERERSESGCTFKTRNAVVAEEALAKIKGDNK